VSAGQRVREPRTARRELWLPRAAQSCAGDLPLVAGAIWAAALFALFVFVPNRHPRAARWDDPSLTHDLGCGHGRLGALGQRLVPADRGARLQRGDAARRPLSTRSIRRRGRARPRALRPLRSRRDPVSLAAALGSFLLLHRIAESGSEPTAHGARCSTSRLPARALPAGGLQRVAYLLLTLAAFMLAERRRFLSAGAVTGLALLTRRPAWRSCRRWR
jgi:hypothetical protein